MTVYYKKNSINANNQKTIHLKGSQSNRNDILEVIKAYHTLYCKFGDYKYICFSAYIGCNDKITFDTIVDVTFGTKFFTVTQKITKKPKVTKINYTQVESITLCTH